MVNSTFVLHVLVFLPILSIVLCSVSRMVTLPPFVFCLNCRRKDNKITVSEQAVMWHAGLRGAIAWALAIKFPSQNRDAIVAATTSVILFTTYVQGGTTMCFLKCMNIPMGAAADVQDDAARNSSTEGSESGSGGGSTSIRRARSRSKR